MSRHRRQASQSLPHKLDLGDVEDPPRAFLHVGGSGTRTGAGHSVGAAGAGTTGSDGDMSGSSSARAAGEPPLPPQGKNHKRSAGDGATSEKP